MKQLLLIMALAMGISANAKSVNAKTVNPLSNIPITDAAGYLVDGSFEVKRFIKKQHEVWAIGILTGTVEGKHINRGLQLPVTLSEVAGGLAAVKEDYKAVASSRGPSEIAAVQCEVLNIAFGPADITVLGLHLHLEPVAINITAEEAPADLLCSIIELIGVVGTVLNTVVGLLNTLLGALGGLG
jgi:hypothetical protein